MARIERQLAATQYNLVNRQADVDDPSPHFVSNAIVIGFDDHGYPLAQQGIR